MTHVYLQNTISEALKMTGKSCNARIKHYICKSANLQLSRASVTQENNEKCMQILK